MQATLVICASQPGILYLNGQFSGEIAPDEPLIRPVSPRGAVYMDYRPLKGGWAGVARKIVFSGGKPMPESVGNAEDIGLIFWPGNISEIEITPPALSGADTRRFSFGRHNFSIRGDVPKLYCGDALLGTLPEDASIPRVIKMEAGYAFLGESGKGMYLLTADSRLQSGTGFLSAGEIDIDSGENITATLTEDDFAGHMTKETWRLTAEGPELISSEAGFQGGRARKPETAEQTALAAVQAALLGKTEETENYLTDELKEENPLISLFGKYDLCTEMKYAHPDNRPCIALIRLEGEHMAVAEPLYYGCREMEGGFLVDTIEFRA